MHLLETSLPEIGLAAALLLGFFASVETGFLIGRRRARAPGREKDAASHLGTIQGAMLGLLALLLGFAFSGATSRFIQRQDIMVQEANAIGTAFLRADLLPAEHRDRLRAALRAYTDARLDLFAESDMGVWGEAAEKHARLVALQSPLWSVTVAGVAERPAAMVAVLPPVNEVIDLLALRDAAIRRHLPAEVLGLLIGCAVVALATIGYGQGLASRRGGSAAVALCILTAAALWVTIDLDYPRRGLIQVNDAPLRAVRESIAEGK